MAADSSRHRIRIGTAGWSLPKAMQERFPGDGSHLERYATRFNAVEINSSFYRPHRPATYARWATSVPATFRFALKLPKTITHERRLVDCNDLLSRFADEIAALESKRGPVLVQMPPSLTFDITIADPFFERVRTIIGGSLVCEPRHPTWFSTDADTLLKAHHIARVAADPAPLPPASEPGGWLGLRYTRLHGSPRIYWSDYDADAIAGHAGRAHEASVENWTIYDNTAAGAALPNALDMFERVRRRG